MDRIKWEASVIEQKLRNELSNYETKLEHLQSHLKDKNQQTQDLKNNIVVVENKLEETREKCAAFVQINARLEVQVKNLELCNESLKHNIEEQKAEINFLHELAEALKNKNETTAAHKYRASAQEELVSTLKSRNNTLETKVEELHEKITSLKAEIVRLHAENNTLAERFESLTQSTESKVAQIEQLRGVINETQQRESSLQHKLNNAQLEMEKLRLVSKQWEQKCAHAEKEWQENDTKYQSFQQQYDILLKERDSLKQAVEEFSENQNLQNQNQNRDQDQNQNNDIFGMNYEMHNFPSNQNKKELNNDVMYLKEQLNRLHSEKLAQDNELEKYRNQFRELPEVINAKEEELRDIKERYTKLEEDFLIASKKYDVLKQHFDGVTRDRSVIIEQLKSEAPQEKDNQHKLQMATTQIEDLEAEKAKLEQEKTKLVQNNMKMQSKNEELKQQYEQIKKELLNAKEEKSKWEAEQNIHHPKQKSLTIPNDVYESQQHIQEELNTLRMEKSSIVQQLEEKNYEIEEIKTNLEKYKQNSNTWKEKFEKAQSQYEFENGQHDNTLRKFHELQSIVNNVQTDIQTKLESKEHLIQELRIKCEQLEQTNHQLQQELTKENENQQQMIDNSNHDAVVNEKVISDEKYNELVNIRAQMEHKLKVLEEQNQLENEKVKQLSDEKQRLTQTIEQYEIKNTELQQQCTQMQQSLSAMQNKVQSSQEQVQENTTEKDIQNMDGKIPQKNNTFAQTLQKYKRLKIEYHKLKRHSEFQEGQLAKQRQELEKRQNIKTSIDIGNTTETIENNINSQSQLTELMTQCHQKDQGLYDLQIAHNDAICRLKQMEAHRQELQEQLRIRKSHMTTLKEETQGMTQSNNDLKVNLNLMQEQLKNLSLALSCTIDTNSMLEQQQKKSTYDLERLKDEAETKEQQLQIYHTKCNKLSEINTQLSKDLQELQLQQGRLKQELFELHTNYKAMEHTKLQLVEEIKGLIQERNELKNKFERITRDINSTSQNKNNASNHKSNKVEIEALRKSKNHYKQKLKSLHPQITEARSEIAKLCEETMNKNQQVNNLKAENTHLRTEMDALLEQQKKQNQNQDLLFNEQQKEKLEFSSELQQQAMKLQQEIQKNQDLSNTLQILEKKLSTMEEENKKLVDSVKEWQIQIENLNGVNKELNGAY